MAAGKMCSRKGKAETAEVCLMCVITDNFSYLLTYWSILSEWVCLNMVHRGLLRFLCNAENCAIVCGSRVTTRRFPPSASQPLFLCLKWTGLFPNELKTEQESLVFVKRMMALAVSSITYLRGIFPEEAYRSRYLEGETQRQPHVIMVDKYYMSPIFLFLFYQTCVSKFCVKTATLVQIKLWSGKYCLPYCIDSFIADMFVCCEKLNNQLKKGSFQLYLIVNGNEFAFESIGWWAALMHWRSVM